MQMIDVVEILQHWHARRPKLLLSASLGVDPKTVRKYVAPAEAEGIAPGDGLAGAGPGGWAAKVAVWFPELVDARARSSTWPLLEAKRELIGDVGDGHGRDGASAAAGRAWADGQRQQSAPLCVAGVPGPEHAGGETAAPGRGAG